MIKLISKKNKIAAEIICDIKNLKNSELKKIKFALNNFGMIYFRNQNLSSNNYLKFAKKFAEALKKEYPEQLLAYNCSPSFNWKKKLDDSQIA